MCPHKEQPSFRHQCFFCDKWSLAILRVETTDSVQLYSILAAGELEGRAILENLSTGKSFLRPFVDQNIFHLLYTITWLIAMGGGTFFKVGGTSARKKLYKNFVISVGNCYVTRTDIWRHLLVPACFSNFVQSLISPQRPLLTLHPIYYTLHWLEHINVTIYRSCSQSYTKTIY